ncbi:MAG: Gfo/Idh/MocA family oxidoreductase [Candidatus Peribacteraceae bacterium]|nr:Gfo/Idh/MocA family oxidoreductase [Candidatus Peribacteraceae bacterium]MDD5075084.1 Gfo/Idh/MocA family oxidoreductase [Candidatus Peribacteraceae bacterium]
MSLRRTAKADRKPFVLVDRAEAPVNVAILGGGFIAEAHADAYRRCGARIVAACDKKGKLARAVVAQAGGRVYTNAETFIKSETRMRRKERPDILVIALPNDLHEQYAMMALEAGLCLDLEKPVATSVGGGMRIQAKSRELNVPVGVPSVYRFDFHVALAHWMIWKGYIGPVRAAFVEYIQGWGLNGRGWRGQKKHNGPAGVMGDVGGTHAHNIFRWLTGIPLEAIRCNLRYDLKPLGEDTDDSMLISGYGKGDVSVRLTASQTRHGNYANTRRFEIAGSRGTLIFDSRRPKNLEWGRGALTTFLPDDPGTILKEFPNAAEFLQTVLFAKPGGDHFNADFGESWGRYVRHLMADVRKFKLGTFNADRPGPYATIDDGVEQLRLISLALLSHSLGGGLISWRTAVE